MSLFQQAPRKVELPFVFSTTEKEALKHLPEGLIKSANHNSALLDLLIESELRDMEWENLIGDCFEALADGDRVKVLRATQNIDTDKKHEVVVQYFYSLSKQYLAKDESKLKELIKSNKLATRCRLDRLDRVDTIISQMKGVVNEVKSDLKPVTFTYTTPIYRDGKLVGKREDKIEKRDLTLRQLNQYKLLQANLNTSLISLCLVKG